MSATRAPTLAQGAPRREPRATGAASRVGPPVAKLGVLPTSGATSGVISGVTGTTSGAASARGFARDGDFPGDFPGDLPGDFLGDFPGGLRSPEDARRLPGIIDAPRNAFVFELTPTMSGRRAARRSVLRSGIEAIATGQSATATAKRDLRRRA